MCADTSLARKENKLGFSVQHSPRSTIHFIAHCSISSKPLTKFQKFIRPTRFLRQELPSYRTKNGEHSVLLSLQGTGACTTGPDPGNMVVDQDLGSQFLLGCKCPVNRGFVVKDQESSMKFPPHFTFKISFNCASRSK